MNISNRIMFLVLLVIICMPTSSIYGQETTTNNICLGDICFTSQSSVVPFETWSRKHETELQGVKMSADKNNTSLCMHNPKDKTYIKIWANVIPLMEEATTPRKYFSGVMVSTLRGCEKVNGSFIPFKPFGTSEGIFLMDDLNKVIRVYGKPEQYKPPTKEERKRVLKEMTALLFSNKKMPLFDDVYIYTPDGEDSFLNVIVFLKKGSVKAIFVGYAEFLAGEAEGAEK